MDFKDNLPIYIQIMNYIKKNIVTEEIKAGEKLPSTRELSKTLTVNPNTIQRAYSELEREDLVYTQRGSGTFTTEDKEKIEWLKRDMAKELIRNFLLEMKSLNLNKQEIKQMIDQYEED